MYGVVDDSGAFSGDNIIFIYPDFLTGIQGQFVDGELVWGLAVEIIGERCNLGLKEIRVRRSKHDPDVVWRQEMNIDQPALPHYIGQHPTVMDPFERKAVYVKQSSISEANEALFARWKTLFGIKL